MTKMDIDKFVNPNTGRISTRIKSYTDLSIEELYCIYNDIKPDSYLQFKSFTVGYINSFKKDVIIDTTEELLKYKDVIITKSGKLETNKLCHIKFSVKEIYDTIYKKGICNNPGCNNETKFISFSKGYMKNCKYCNNVAGGIKAREKSIKTCEEKYGVNHPMKNKSVVDKKIKSMTKNGVYNNNYKKAKQTEKERYGMNFQLTDTFKEKRKDTCIERYGVENPFKVENIILNIQKRRKITMIKEGKWLSDEEKSLVDIYYNEVNKITSRNHKFIPNIEKRGRRDTNSDSFEIDHKFSIIEGFKHNIPPYIIGSIYNLEMLHWKENATKSSECSITKQELFKAFDKSRSI